MKIKPATGKAAEALNELPFAEAAIAAICYHANIVRTLYNDVRPIFAAPEEGDADHSLWNNVADFQSHQSHEIVQESPQRVREWQVRMVMENCKLGARSLLRL